MRMHNQKADTELLEALRLQTGADYISDLRNSPYREAALRRLKRISQESYDRAVWTDVWDYLSVSGPEMKKARG